MFIGIDNGVTGSVAIVGKDSAQLFPIPIKKELSYTKVKKFISRIDYDKLYSMLYYFSKDGKDSFVFLERPMVNPKRFAATLSAMRALEATLITLEKLDLPYRYIDSKEWQKEFLPSGLKGEELKKASVSVGKRMFPDLCEEIDSIGDADALLIAAYARRIGCL